MESGSIASWLLKEGDEFAAGQAICEVETDKATVSYEATDEGFIAKILVGTGELQVGEPMMVTVEEAGDVSAFANFTLADAGGSAPAAAPSPTPEEPRTQTPAPTPAQSAPAQSAAPVQSSGGRVVASPYARKLAREAGIDLSALPANGFASGPNGRVLASDVESAISKGVTSAPAPTQSTSAPAASSAAPVAASVNSGSESTASFVDSADSPSSALSALFAHSKKVVPHYMLSVEVNLSKLMALREELGEDKVAVQDFLIKAATKAMAKVTAVVLLVLTFSYCFF